MSNHDIGHAMDQVIETILDLYDEGAYSVDTAKTLINKAVYVVCGYEGNDYEALEYITDTHCSCCLKAYADHEFFITPMKLMNALRLKIIWDVFGGMRAVMLRKA